ncbi:MAG: 2-oxoacid:acceptor oxidoreductase subunit alpha [Proteobacteria bacterium]|nr:2-oxoacid:acceptor oxidoreductase subunit alpha [Pseudomonadota bacterium]MBU1641276.1 2-oxoacid:acceptor oxidoreductase subunit alpha [Pseudomonadota bacterium]
MEYSIRIGGEAGQGLQLIGGVLAKYFVRAGFYVFSHQDYMSRVRGGHNFYQITFADRLLESVRDTYDLLVALDLPTIALHRHQLNNQGHILYDQASCGGKQEGEEFLDIPLALLVEELNAPRVMVSSASIGAVLAVLDLPLAPFQGIIGDFISKKTEEIVASNYAVANAAFVYARAHYDTIPSVPVATLADAPLMLINGSQAIGLGALASGCKFYAAYPMTPATGIMNYIAGKAAKYGIVVEQAEDEISAINMALGASYAGVRAMTGTSGGGFALMTEGLSLAGITETPVVIAEVQRPGPATGLPTRTEQSDLLFVLHGGHGEFPRVIFAPGTPEQAFYLTNKAFHLAEKYQIPVFIQSDQYLADCQWSLADFDSRLLYQEDFRLRGELLVGLESYQRYAYTESGISPLAIPGDSEHLVVVDSDEHDEDGHIIEDAPTRNLMVEKRLFKKMALLREEISPPLYYGEHNPQAIVVGYGSTFGVLKEAVEHLAGEFKIGLLYFSEIYPFPLLEQFDYVALLKEAPVTICVENNATSQFARVLHGETNHRCTYLINKYDGRPFTLQTLIGEIHAYL